MFGELAKFFVVLQVVVEPPSPARRAARRARMMDGIRDATAA
jgi:hypothetical protein